MKPKQNLIPGHQAELAKQVKPQAQPQPQSAEMILLQFNDHARNISKSISAMGDIVTLFYNQMMAQANSAKDAKPPT